MSRQTTCDYGNHLLCISPECACGCHDDLHDAARRATTDAVLAVESGGLDGELADLFGGAA